MSQEMFFLVDREWGCQNAALLTNLHRSCWVSLFSIIPSGAYLFVLQASHLFYCLQ